MRHSLLVRSVSTTFESRSSFSVEGKYFVYLSRSKLSSQFVYRRQWHGCKDLGKEEEKRNIKPGNPVCDICILTSIVLIVNLVSLHILNGSEGYEREDNGPDHTIQVTELMILLASCKHLNANSMRMIIRRICMSILFSFSADQFKNVLIILPSYRF